MLLTQKRRQSFYDDSVSLDGSWSVGYEERLIHMDKMFNYFKSINIDITIIPQDNIISYCYQLIKLLDRVPGRIFDIELNKKANIMTFIEYKTK